MSKTYYTQEQIREAVDIVIGDDGFRSKEVIEVLKTEFIKHLESQVDRHIETLTDKARGK